MKAVHVDVGSVGLEYGPRGHAPCAALTRARRRGGVEQAATRAHRLHHLPEGGELGVLTRGSDEERAARRRSGLREPAGGASRKERLARVSARTRRAVAFQEERRRAPGRVIAGLAFALEDDGTAVRREEVADPCAGDAGPDDQEVAVVACRGHRRILPREGMRLRRPPPIWLNRVSARMRRRARNAQVASEQGEARWPSQRDTRPRSHAASPAAGRPG